MNILEIQIIELALIDPHPWNRKDFDRKKLDELKEDVAENGIETPLQLRQKADGRYEIIKGERRFTVAKELEFVDVPAQVASKDDVTAFLTLLRDNLQREDLSPLQEAAGYHRLLAMMDADGQAFTPSRISERLHRNIHTVHRRLKLVHLPASAREALQQGLIAERTAFLIGRLPTEKMRDAVTEYALTPLREWVSGGWKERLPTVQEVQENIEENHVTNLKGCGWPLADDSLVPLKPAKDGKTRLHGGACEGCEYLARHNPDFADDLRGGAGQGTGKRGQQAGLDPLTCINPACRQLKDVAWSKRRVEELRKEGCVVIDGKKAEDLLHSNNDHVSLRSNEYVPAGDKPGYSDLGHFDYDKAPTWAKLEESAKKAGVAAPARTVIVHPKSGRHLEVYKRSEILAAAKKARPEMFKKRSNGSSAPKRDLFKEKLDRELGFAGMTALVEALGKKDIPWDLVFEIALSNTGGDGIKWVANWLKVEKVKGAYGGRDYLKPILKAVKEKSTTNAQYLDMTIGMLLVSEMHWKNITGEDFKRLAKNLEIDSAKLKEKVTADLKAKEKPKAKKAKPKKAEAERKPEMKSRSKSVTRNIEVVSQAEKAETAVAHKLTSEQRERIAEAQRKRWASYSKKAAKKGSFAKGVPETAAAV